MALNWRSTLAAALMAPLGGCILLPIPSDIPLTGAHKGRVSDAMTGKPLEGVRISFVDHAEVPTVTDANGEFLLAPVTQHRNWTGILLLAPVESYCEDKVAFDKKGYRQFVARKADAHPGTGNCK